MDNDSRRAGYSKQAWVREKAMNRGDVCVRESR